MSTSEIINEIQQLPVNKRLEIVEQALKSIRISNTKTQMLQAANEMQEEYRTNKELTAFTSLDLEDFYETK